MITSSLGSTSLKLRRAVLWTALAVAAAAHVIAQAPSNELSQYTDAVAHVQPLVRLELLQQFAMHAQPGPLKVNALELVIWHYLQTGDTAHALAWANDLENTDNDNAVALAIISQHTMSLVEQGSLEPEPLLRMASHGLDMLPQTQRPLGMSELDFALLRRQAYAMLSGAAGFAEVRMKDYPS